MGSLGEAGPAFRRCVAPGRVGAFRPAPSSPKSLFPTPLEAGKGRSGQRRPRPGANSPCPGGRKPLATSLMLPSNKFKREFMVPSCSFHPPSAAACCGWRCRGRPGCAVVILVPIPGKTTSTSLISPLFSISAPIFQHLSAASFRQEDAGKQG